MANGIESHGNIFANAEYTQIYIRLGRWNDGSKRQRMAPAAFRLLKMSTADNGSTEMYMETVGFDIGGVYFDRQSTGAQTMPPIESYTGRSGLGLWGGHQLILDENEMGASHTEGWRELHAFGVL